MLHKGTLYLSRAQKPTAARALDGTLTVTLLAIDRTPAGPQPYLLIWSGCQALAFWALHSDELTEGAALAVELLALRLHTTSTRPQITQLLADVVSLQVIPAAKTRHHLKQKQPAARADVGLAAIY